MTEKKLYDDILEKLRELNPEFHLEPLHKAMLMECCENAMQPQNKEIHSYEVLTLAALQAFQVCNGMMKGIIIGLIPQSADTITLNYRGETFILDRDSPIVKKALANS